MKSAIIQFVKTWTLPLAMAVGAIIYLLFAFLPPLDALGEGLEPFFTAILPLFMFLILFVTFCKVDYQKLIPVPWHFWVGVFQVVFVWILVGLILVCHLQGNSLILVESILTCIIGPCAAAAAVVTQKLGGSLEEMTTYTFISNCICAALIPICFPMIDTGSHFSFWSAFVTILYEVSIVLLVPMLLAYIVKHAKILRRFYHWILGFDNLGFYLWCFSLMIVTGTTVKNIVHAQSSVWFLLVIAFMGLILCIIQFAVGRYVGHFFHRNMEAGQALGQKNTAFAIWIAITYLNPLASVGPGCYILWQNIINSIEIWIKDKHDSQINNASDEASA